MQSSHRILSRLLHSPRKGYIRASVGGSVHFLALFDEKDNGFVDTTHRSFSSLIRSSSHVRGLISTNCLNKGLGVRCSVSLDRETPLIDTYSSHRNFFTRAKQVKRIEINDQHSQRAVTTALWCNFLVFSLKFGVWWTSSSHVIMAEVVHSVADFANQALLAYGLSSSRRAPDALHPYGYSKERFVWSLISAVGIFCLGSGATIVNGVQNLWTSSVIFGISCDFDVICYLIFWIIRYSLYISLVVHQF
jgi:zinc transporter 9